MVLAAMISTFNLNLNTEMELNQSRESVIHFFELLKKKYPSMRNFYCRDRGDCVLEEDKSRGHYRWASVEPRRVCSGYVNPDSLDSVLESARIDLGNSALCVVRQSTGL